MDAGLHPVFFENSIQRTRAHQPNQNMIAGCSELPSFPGACSVTVSSRAGGLRSKFWYCGIS
jgi:hypothetical protein